jgi:hypothetical protein
MLTRRALRLTVAAALATLALAPSSPAAERLPALAPAAPDALSRALAAGELTEAQYALERARALFRLDAVRATHGMVNAPGLRDATLVLRDLALRVHDLPADEQAIAQGILARPTDSPDPEGNSYTTDEAPPYCTANACIHYVATTRDAPPSADANDDDVPDYIETVGAELEVVWAKEVDEYGYRAPKSDLTSTNHGPDGRIDIYVADIGDDGLYGYCQTDDPALTPSVSTYDFSAYCVVDDDFSPGQFGTTSGIDALRVTLAHEFFHAVQFAYDYLDDGWLFEATSTWMEDEVYDDIDDNLQYLAASPLARPGVPLDLWDPNPSSSTNGTQYGTFIFFRYLSEKLGDPSIVRRIWERADGAAGGPDDYSVQAIHNALRGYGSAFPAMLAAFAAANAFPAAFYEEGSAYPSPPIARRKTLTAIRPSAEGFAILDHLTSVYHSLRPGAGVGANARLRVTLDLPPRGQAPQATLVVVQTNGALQFVPLRLNAKGNGAARVPFGRGTVKAVLVVLTNASMRYVGCFAGPPTFACSGTPVDDGRRYEYTARVV